MNQRERGNMSYTALYRKYRPQTFSDVKGQDHIITTLQNQVKTERIGHAYLMCGTRGTGKTTIARIFAKAVNCENPTGGNPCELCGSCRSINEGSSLNVIEIDAASNNGVDNIRRIREEVAYRPTEGKYKVYIIDEVHMLSARGAFPALLKTLEEPPSYVIFILATTEKHGIPVTILSRCQQYDLKRMRIETIAHRIGELLVGEGVIAEERAILYIAKQGEGSMRDALSLLDQCIAFHMGEDLTYDKVLKVLGAVEIEVFSQLLRGVLKGDVARVMGLIEEIMMEGSELSQFVSDFTWHLRNLLLLKTSDNIESDRFVNQVEETLNVTSENIQILKEEAKLIEVETLLRFIRITSKLSEQLRFTTQKRVAVEVAFVKLSVPATETNVDSLIERIRVLEERLESAVISVGGFQGNNEKHQIINGQGEYRDSQVVEVPEESHKIDNKEIGQQEKKSHKIDNKEIGQQKKEPEEGISENYQPSNTDSVRTYLEKDEEKPVDKIVKEFSRYLTLMSPLVKAYFSDRNQYRVRAEGGHVIKILHRDEGACNMISTQDKKARLEQIIQEQTGEKVEIKVLHHQEKQEEQSQGIEQILQEKIKFPITEM